MQHRVLGATPHVAEHLPDPSARSEQHLLLAALSPCGNAVTKCPLADIHSLRDQSLRLMCRSGNLVTNQSWQDFFLNEGLALRRHLRQAPWLCMLRWLLWASLSPSGLQASR